MLFSPTHGVSRPRCGSPGSMVALSVASQWLIGPPQCLVLYFRQPQLDLMTSTAMTLAHLQQRILSRRQQVTCDLLIDLSGFVAMHNSCQSIRATHVNHIVPSMLAGGLVGEQLCPLGLALESHVHVPDSALQALVLVQSRSRTCNPVDFGMVGLDRLLEVGTH